jgi:hypothetical protein
MIGHLAEAGVVIHDEFREGNIAPATGNLEFVQACEAHLPKGHRIAHVRLDSAGYQASIFNLETAVGRARWCVGSGDCRIRFHMGFSP